MSFFGGGQPQNNGPNPVSLAKIEAEVITDMFNKMASMCNKKCVGSYHDGELQVGEMACVDRCISKYMQTQEKVGEVLQAFEKQVKAQEAMGLQMQSAPKFGPGAK